jgi:hypothetical protein
MDKDTAHDLYASLTRDFLHEPRTRKDYAAIGRLAGLSETDGAVSAAQQADQIRRDL